MINKLALFVVHNIFLTEKQIDTFFNKNSIKTIGVSVPVWVNSKNSKTTEPGFEYFCNYQIVLGEQEDVSIQKCGYKLFLPKPRKIRKTKHHNVDFNNLSKNEREYHERKIEKWNKEHPEYCNLDNLKKSKYFRTSIKKYDQNFSKLECLVDIQHTIEIKSMDLLMKSLC
jgi:hypothetical protein